MGVKDTFRLTLPDGKVVTCWRREAEAIRLDVAMTGNVFLRQAGGEVYERVDPASVEAIEMLRTGARQVQ